MAALELSFFCVGSASLSSERLLVSLITRIMLRLPLVIESLAAPPLPSLVLC